MSDPPLQPGPELLAFQAAVAGRYSITHELGRGGMGIVFLAREVALDRMVALKLLPPEMAARPELKERFLAEARTAARLSHPNIVQIHAVDEADGFVFFAMAYVDGGTLGDRLRARGPLSHAAATRLLREVAWALGHAHLQGVVHRDVKPDNILLEEDTGRALVTDFGIAVVGEGTEGTDARQVVGTAEFMSPEAAVGGAVDARSDLYSLGCVGFYALSGQVPFRGDSAAAVLLAHVEDPPPPLLSVAPHVPPALATVVDRCLRKDPALRFDGGDALAEALGRDEVRDAELAVPLRVFIKESREWESRLSVGLAGLLVFLPILVVQVLGDAPLNWTFASALAVAGFTILPFATLLRATRRLLASGFTRSDATDAFLRDIDKREEEYRFQVGERVTAADRAARGLKWGGFGLGVGAFGLAALGLDPVLTTGVGSVLINVGIWGTLVGEVRARARGDIMGERFHRFWSSAVGRGLFRLGAVGLDRVTPALASGVHRPTEAVLGLEADRLFEALPRETRRSLAGLPGTVESLEAQARAMRQRVREMESVLAEIGDVDPSHPSAAERARVRAGVEATRDEAREKLQGAVAALEGIRLGLLYMKAGTPDIESLTMELQAARRIAGDMDRLLEGHREVERLLDERRRTGVLRLVTDPG